VGHGGSPIQWEKGKSIANKMGKKEKGPGVIKTKGTTNERNRRGREVNKKKKKKKRVGGKDVGKFNAKKEPGPASGSNRE